MTGSAPSGAMGGRRARRLLLAARTRPLATMAVVVVLLAIIAAIAAPWLAPHDPTDQSLPLRLRPPWPLPDSAAGHPLGTDALGRDVLSRILYGARVSMLVGVGAVALQALVGVSAGLVAGFYRGAVDQIVMRLADVQQSIPFLVLVVAVAAVVGPSLRNTILVLGLAGWVTYGRVVRAQVLSLMSNEYVAAAQALGSSDRRVMLRHLLPNLVAPITVIGTLTISAMILVEASLSFLGLGVPPPAPTWGGMVADGRNYIADAWWVSVMPGLAIFLTVLSVNLVGDALREALDPSLRT
ncbi:MAG: ABC transporter permease [Trueperaceae bacterium]|nr:ABC transporter permease [Trueperaceae bacterium]